ncbi:hypothetical protein K505DRAFT_126704 [Melanomma pulvis-pyrius CBS 109.77]|uniref:Uncharacterized protein n=1 Tax=Melanomma pulvis-pyrius CBS 109.77 TaxID=1314802 RepID=A0A6A6WUB7_9PLEO|nr:hypothetical protein K505DRAFT_126704 [Melanomma pulvis-pyrius CBS 109.77]
MGTVRDPDFWRRFSRAVHQDEEAQAQKEQRPGIKHSDSWLESQRKKKRQRTWICWVFWLSLAGLITGIVVCVLLLKARKII